MKKRLLLQISALPALVSAVLVLCSCPEASAQQRYTDALYRKNDAVARAVSKENSARTDSLIAKTIKIKEYDDPRLFLLDNTSLTWTQIDRLFWKGPFSYNYGPYGVFGPYYGYGYGYGFGPFGGFYGRPYNYYGWCGGPYGYYGNPYYGGCFDMYDLYWAACDIYGPGWDPAFWGWGGFDPYYGRYLYGGYSPYCGFYDPWMDPWFVGAPYHYHDHYYLEGRPHQYQKQTPRVATSRMSSGSRGFSAGGASRSSVAGSSRASANTRTGATSATASAVTSRASAQAASGASTATTRAAASSASRTGVAASNMARPATGSRSAGSYSGSSSGSSAGYSGSRSGASYSGSRSSSSSSYSGSRSSSGSSSSSYSGSRSSYDYSRSSSSSSYSGSRSSSSGSSYSGGGYSGGGSRSGGSSSSGRR